MSLPTPGRRRFLAALVLASSVAISACGSVASPSPAASASAGSKVKLAMILPGPIVDADYNAVGYQALQEVKKKTGAQVSYSEQVAVADAERVAREYLSAGNTVIAFHGGQFLTIVKKLAAEFPDKVFIMESSGQVAGLPGNVWNVGRKFYQGFYALGVLAAASTKTNKIGFIAGVRLPDFIASLNAVKEAARRTNPNVQVLSAFTGDQNDQVKARETAAAQINAGADVIIASVNNGVYGIVQAARASTGRKVLVTTYYTDKTSTAPEIFTTSLLSDFSKVYLQVVDKIQKGQTGGYIEMRPGNGFDLAPIKNAPAQAAEKARAAFNDVVANKLIISEVTDRILD